MNARRPIRAFRIGNFKAFADTQRIALKPITLIFGPNSAGKSSFIHSLALAHEAQFGREKGTLGGNSRRLDVHRTDIGGSAIDLGGFRQYIYRGQATRRVEWGAELEVAALEGRLGQLLAPIRNVTVSMTLGIELDNLERPKPGAEPRVEAIEISGDNVELVRMSRRTADGQGSTLRLDRLASEHTIFRQIVKAIVESTTTTEKILSEDFEGANEAISNLLPELQVRVERFFPGGVELPRAELGDSAPTSILFPVSRGNRREDIAQAVRFYLPRTLNELVKGLGEVLGEELKKLQYLGPLRSFPPRHLAFSEHEDVNWYAGGGYAWDLVRRDEVVRSAVNSWLGSKKLGTPYALTARSLIALDQIREPILTALEGYDEVMRTEEVDERTSDSYPVKVIEDVEASAESLSRAVRDSQADRVTELVLLDQRTNTIVTHRDVGIGITQVLPVLVLAYGSQGKLLAMEQPEIHLHPALQAELGDVFIESALGERNNTFILETHSEHLINRIMRRIREKKVRSSDIAVVYAEPLSRGSRFLELRLDKEGDFIDEWPGGFFEESYHEKFASR